MTNLILLSIVGFAVIVGIIIMHHIQPEDKAYEIYVAAVYLIFTLIIICLQGKL